MRQILLTLGLCLAVALAVGCKPTDKKAEVLTQQRDDAVAKLDQASTNAQVAQEALEDYTYAQKADFVKRMKQDLSGIQDELDRLSGKIERSKGASKAEARKQLAAVRKEWTAAKLELDKAEQAQESDWGRVKDAFKTANEKLKTSFEKTRQWLSDKIEP